MCNAFPILSILNDKKPWFIWKHYKFTKIRLIKSNKAIIFFPLIKKLLTKLTITNFLLLVHGRNRVFWVGGTAWYRMRARTIQNNEWFWQNEIKLDDGRRGSQPLTWNLGARRSPQNDDDLFVFTLNKRRCCTSPSHTNMCGDVWRSLWQFYARESMTLFKIACCIDCNWTQSTIFCSYSSFQSNAINLLTFFVP